MLHTVLENGISNEINNIHLRKQEKLLKPRFSFVCVSQPISKIFPLVNTQNEQSVKLIEINCNLHTSDNPTA